MYGRRVPDGVEPAPDLYATVQLGPNWRDIIYRPAVQPG